MRGNVGVTKKMTKKDVIRNKIKRITFPMFPVGFLGIGIIMFMQLRGVNDPLYWSSTYAILGIISIVIVMRLWCVACPECKKPIGFSFVFSGTKGNNDSAIKYCPHCGVDLDMEMKT